MEVATQRNGPRTVTSRRSIKYRPSSWQVHEFTVENAGGEPVCSAVALRMEGSLLLWAGSAPRLASAALSLPEAGCAALLGEEQASSSQLARRLALRLRRPVYVCCGDEFDRFTLPIVERGLVQEIKSKPDCFI